MGPDEKIKCFEPGHWYKWVGPKTRPEGWSPDGKMDFMLDGKPHKSGGSCFGESADFPDSGDPRYQWFWGSGFEHIREVPAPGLEIVMPVISFSTAITGALQRFAIAVTKPSWTGKRKAIRARLLHL